MGNIQKVPNDQIEPILDLDNLIEGWSAVLRADYSEHTAAAYIKSLRLFREWLAKFGVDLDGVNPTHVRMWREVLAVSYAEGTVNLRLGGVRSFYYWLIEQGAPIMNPAAAVRGASRKGVSRRHKRAALTKAEVRSLMATCDSTAAGRRDLAIISLMAYCALRSVEIQRADLADLDTRDGWTVLWVRGKGHAEADDFAILPPPAEEALRFWLVKRGDKPGPLFVGLGNRNRGRMTLRSIRRIVKERMKSVGILNGRKTTHSLRHTAITAAIRAGASPLAVQAMARHKSFDTTQNYIHEVGRTADPAERYIDYGD